MIWFGWVLWHTKHIDNLMPNLLHTYILDIRGTINKVPDFFVQAFKIVVDT